MLLIAAIGALLVLWLKIPPRASRILPECDAILYANLKLIRTITHLQDRPVPHSEDYQRFIEATGIVVERDLDSVAFALTRMPDPTGPNGPVAFSEVFLGRFDAAKLTRYLESVATSQESYAGRQVYVMPVTLPAGPASHIAPTGRTLRVALIDKEMVAVSNAPTPEQIHSMLDRAGAQAGIFSGPTLLSALYSEVPLLSSIWGIGAIALPFGEQGHVSAFGVHLPLADATPFVASLRYTTGVGLRIEQLAATDEEAARSVQKLTTLLSLARTMQRIQPVGAGASSMREFFDSLTIRQSGSRAILTARIPVDLLRQISHAQPVLSQIPVPASPLNVSRGKLNDDLHD